MKRLKVLFLLLSILPIALNAQSSDKQKELGLTMNNIQLERFGITYKFGKPSAMWRLSALSANAFNSSSFFNDINNEGERFGFDLSAGREFRKVVKNDFELRYGVDVGFSYVKVKSERINNIDPEQNRSNENTSYQPQVKFVLGVNYVLNDKIVFGFEVLPGLTYNFSENIRKQGLGEEEKTENHSFSFGTSGEFALFSVAYRF